MINELISTMSLEEGLVFRKKLSQKIQYTRKKKSLRMEVYIQAEYRDAVELAKEWAYENGLIKRNTKWTFAKFCIINTTKMILAQIETNKNEKLRQEAIENSQRQAQPTNVYQNGTEPPHNYQK